MGYLVTLITLAVILAVAAIPALAAGNNQPAPTTSNATALAPMPAQDANWFLDLLNDDRVAGQMREKIRAYLGLDPKGNVGVPESTDITRLNQNIDKLTDQNTAIMVWVGFSAGGILVILVLLVILLVIVVRFIRTFNIATANTPPPPTS